MNNKKELEVLVDEAKKDVAFYKRVLKEKELTLMALQNEFEKEEELRFLAEEDRRMEHQPCEEEEDN